MQVHGSAFEFGRNAAFDARNFFDRRNEANPADHLCTALMLHLSRTRGLERAAAPSFSLCSFAPFFNVFNLVNFGLRANIV
jgi:hypothetical protein